MGSSYGAIGPMRAATVHSKLAVRPARSGGLHAGSMSTFWKRYRGASTTTPGHAAAAGDSRTSVRHYESPHGGDALPHQNASKSSRRDGSLGPGLQSHTGHEHRRYQAADGCDRGLRPIRSWLLTDFPGKGVFTRPRPICDIRAIYNSAKAGTKSPGRCRGFGVAGEKPGSVLRDERATPVEAVVDARSDHINVL